MKLKNLSSLFYNQPLMMTEARALELDSFLQARMSGMAGLSEAEMAELKKANEPPHHEKGQNIAVLPLFGTLHQHASMMDSMSGGTNLTKYQSQLKAAAKDSTIGTIVLEVHSPGGSAYATKETADLVHKISKEKRVVTVANSQMASAALYIGMASNQVFMTPGGEGGSLGVLQIHQDISKAQEAIGIKTTLIATPRKKVEGNPYEPLPADVIEDIERQHKVLYDQFVADVARYRGGGKSNILDNYGGGGMLLASEAKASGMVDDIATFDEVIDDILGKARAKGRGNRNRMALAEIE